ncbi:MAG: hypothetical protein Q8K60_05545 [Parachlamydiaceae bacterium]|nr:hypothetical protein [Parachlamydiaceae bacterium]
MPDPSQPIRPIDRAEGIKITGVQPETKENGVDSGVSSIKKSKAVIPPQLLDLNIPILIPPLNLHQLSSIELKDMSLRIKANFLMEITGQINEIKDQILSSWSENLKQLREDFENYLKSPLYQQMIAAYRKETQGLTASGAPIIGNEKNAELGITAVLNHVRMIEQISPTDSEIKAKSLSSESNFNHILPFSISMVVGGGLAITTSGLSEGTSNPLAGAINFVENLQPLLPLQVTAQDIIPFINLMVTAPIYYHSWNEAVRAIFNREGQNNLVTSQKFAEDIIKMVSDPTFNILGLIRGIAGVEKLTPEQQKSLSSMLKFIIIGVALSLLYAAEVGKATGKEFGGMTPEELRDLLNGKIAPDSNPDRKLTHHEQLTLTLIKQAQDQLAQLSRDHRLMASALLLQYVEAARAFNPMTDPEKVFVEALGGDDFPIPPQLESVRG